MGQSPSSETYNEQREGLPFFQGKADFGAHYPSIRFWCTEPTKVAVEESILFSVRAPVGAVNIAPTECCIGRGLAAINGTSVDQSFLYQKIQFSNYRFQLLAQGSTFEAVNGSEMRDFPLTLPPLPEQQKIASILSSVDDVITKTTAQIEKLRDLKTGMMQELLTKGIGHTEFKQLGKWTTGKIAEIDQIPASWELVNIQSVARLESGHTPSRDNPCYWGGEYQWVSLHDTKQLGATVVHRTVLTVTQEGLDNSSARLLPRGTVAFSRTASVGHCVIFGSEMATSQDFANYVCGDSLCNRYLFHLFRWMQHVWASLAEGSTHKTIYMPVFKKLQILLPPVSEQEAIADLADSIDVQVSAVRKKLDALIDLKKAVMQDLLTGAVRVAVDA
jgi:type I restriction enzyme S subunit